MLLGSPRLLLAICVASALWAFSFGLGTQLCTHWLKAEGASNIVIGLNHSLYYLGIALASIGTPRLNRTIGNRCAAAGMVLFALTLAAFPWGGGNVGYMAWRLANGMAAALCLVPLETLVSRSAPPHQRTRNFSLYGLSILLGGAAGIGLGLEAYRLLDWLAFAVAGVAPLVAGCALLFLLPNETAAADEEEVGLESDVSRSVLAYGTGWCQGFLEGGLLAFLSLYLLSLQLSESAAGGMMGVLMAGVILFQLPVAWLADRCGRLQVLLGCYTVIAATLAVIPWAGSSLWLAICLFMLGACSGAMYPLGLSLLGERISEGGLARAYAWYLAMECVGSQVGAAAMGQARDWWGEAGMFGAGLAAVGLVLGAWGLMRLRATRGKATIMPRNSDSREMAHAGKEHLS